jgi:hypothetical protein
MASAINLPTEREGIWKVEPDEPLEPEASDELPGPEVQTTPQWGHRWPTLAESETSRLQAVQYWYVS